MAYAKVISTSFGVTIAVVSPSGVANINRTNSVDLFDSYTGHIIPLKNMEITALDLYHSMHPSLHHHSEEEENDIKIYKQNITGEKVEITKDTPLLTNQDEPAIIYFEETNPLYPSTIRLGALISGGPDGIIATSLMKEAGSLQNKAIEGYDFFYIKPGRPSDWQEYTAINNFLTTQFPEQEVQLHVVDLSPNKMRIVLCGDYEATYNRFGLASALSLVAAKCDTLNNKPDVLLFGIHAADAAFKARKSNEYTRQFIHSWNKFWKLFYPSASLVIAPFIDIFDKVDILNIAKLLGIDIAKTWSCYRGGENHCGECKSCLERRLAHQIAEIPDPTKYEKTPKISKLTDHIGWVSLNNNDQKIALSSS